MTRFIIVQSKDVMTDGCTAEWYLFKTGPCFTISIRKSVIVAVLSQNTLNECMYSQTTIREAQE